MINTIKLTIVLLLLLPTAGKAQDTAKAFLTRYEKRNTFFQIPLTNFCFIEGTGYNTEYTNGWVMKWDLAPNPNSNMLVMEMNASEVYGVAEGHDISGSVQVVLQLPRFDDSIMLPLVTEKTKGIHVVNNNGGDGKKYLKGWLNIHRHNGSVTINCSLKLIAKKPHTKQLIILNNISVAETGFAAYQLMRNKADSLEKKKTDDFANALTKAVIYRDSVWNIEKARIKDSLAKHPYQGPFRFWVSQVDKAEWYRATYEVTQNSLLIKEGSYDFIYIARNYPEDKKVFKKRFTKSERAMLDSLGKKLLTDTIKEYYWNRCIIDGLIVSFDFEWTGAEKQSTLENYYTDKLAGVIAFINRVSPKKYRIWYNKEELVAEQEKCKAKHK